MAEFIVREIKEVVTEALVVAKDGKGALDQFRKNQHNKNEPTVFVASITEEYHSTVREKHTLYLEVNNND
ncbi:hypothetical protein MKY29_02860 [Psychrobacillus sp. FSL K6-2365]|uniref:hypothetical protein n=1 Tax=Psychrobacillus sp. FSL K6-2365 TaxID=2921546 RepID=UPI0030F99745